MTSPRRARTVVEVSDPYANYLLQVPPSGEGICITCHSSVYDGYERCLPCNRARQKLGPLVFDATAFVSLAPSGQQLARELITYKKEEIPEKYRHPRMAGLAAVLWRWLSVHEAHVAQRAGTPGFSMVTPVPSTRGRPGEHPLKRLVSGIVAGTGDRYVDLLEAHGGDRGREVATDRFTIVRPVAAASVLVIDDTWTSGARAQSAAAALKLAGTSKVGFVGVGRWFNTDFADNAKWLIRRRRTRWNWDRCCLE
ncbi:hypothetical protein [Parafrankia soli]|uniref:hypothetical protein n=1 Tax=Parafrankia soli TaxID=2599596 RepID=UPI0018E3D5B7|nr:hypothetical protein [Parafrankia soli]